MCFISHARSGLSAAAAFKIFKEQQRKHIYRYNALMARKVICWQTRAVGVLTTHRSRPVKTVRLVLGPRLAACPASGWDEKNHTMKSVCECCAQQARPAGLDVKAQHRTGHSRLCAPTRQGALHASHQHLYKRVVNE